MIVRVVIVRGVSESVIVRGVRESSGCERCLCEW